MAQKTVKEWLAERSMFTNAEVNALLDRAEKAEKALAELRESLEEPNGVKPG